MCYGIFVINYFYSVGLIVLLWVDFPSSHREVVKIVDELSINTNSIN